MSQKINDQLSTMTTPRSPVGGVRKVTDTSFESQMEQEQEPKAQKTDEAPWDLLLRTMNEVKAETSATNKRVDALVSRVGTLEEKVAEEAERNGGLEEAVSPTDPRKRDYEG